jgi:hypothetical protein
MMCGCLLVELRSKTLFKWRSHIRVQLYYCACPPRHWLHWCRSIRRPHTLSLNVIVPSRHGSSKMFHSLKFSDRNVLSISHLHHPCYVPVLPVLLKVFISPWSFSLCTFRTSSAVYPETSSVMLSYGKKIRYKNTTGKLECGIFFNLWILKLECKIFSTEQQREFL